MFRVSFIYAPYPSQIFRTKEEALAFQASQIAATKLEKKNLFGKWKVC